MMASFDRSFAHLDRVGENFLHGGHQLAEKYIPTICEAVGFTESSRFRPRCIYALQIHQFVASIIQDRKGAIILLDNRKLFPNRKYFSRDGNIEFHNRSAIHRPRVRFTNKVENLVHQC